MLVVGGGPTGASVGLRLARAGHDVTVVEKRPTDRQKACGDTLSPRTLGELDLIGVDPSTLGGHEVRGVRMTHRHQSLEVPWPEHTIYPNWGAVIRRADLDMRVAGLATEQGAVIRQRTEATAIVDEGELVGPLPTFRIVQGSIEIESGRAAFVVPAAFDPSRPFRIEAELPSGEYYLAPSARIAVPVE